MTQLVTDQEIIPTDREMTAQIQKLADRHYGGQHLPNLDFFNMHRPDGWRRAEPILRNRGLPDSPDGWRSLCVLLGFGLPVADRRVNLLRTLRENRAALPPGLGVPVTRSKTAWMYGEGLPVIQRLRPVIAWCIRRHTYVVVGHRRTYEVR